MLKDLDQRNGEQQSSSTVAVPIQAGKSPRNGILLGLIIIIVINVVGLFVWQLYVENQNYQQKQNQQVQAKTITATQKKSSQIAVQEAPIQQQIISESKVSQLNTAQPIPQQKLVQATNQAESIENKGSDKQAVELLTPPIVNPIAIVPIKEAVVSQEPIKQEEETSMTVSRHQLSPETLSKQKMVAAEQAIENNDIELAEKLFEDILIILPSNQDARKQLAALWFGRQSYQAALNLLSQGIQLNPSNSEFRLMQARIYLQQSRTADAFQVLNVLNQTQDIEYQTTLANLAQQLGYFQSAIEAYQILNSLQPKQGRWAMGLAIAYDSNSQFTEASKAYQRALKLDELSGSARVFIKQRLKELGV